MAPTQTTTLRVPVGLRDEIARLAEDRGTSMAEVVTEAIKRLTRDHWWSSVQASLDAMTIEDIASYQAETLDLDCSAADGLNAR